MIPKQSQVFLRRAVRSDYGVCESDAYPELPADVHSTVALHTLRHLFHDAGMDSHHYGTSSWNPLGGIIKPLDKVVIKPNWVLHENYSGYGLDCLITNATLIEAITHYVAKAKPSDICLGDAPVQGCNFSFLLEKSGINEMCNRLQKQGLEIQPRDFRLVTSLDKHYVHGSQKGTDRNRDEYVLFDLGDSSALEAISEKSEAFRVTCYDPAAMQRTHSPGHHRYLVARECIEASVIINVPKLKTHKKACITGTLKNIVGINGHKEFLPHHRKGSPVDNGDCYEQHSWYRSIVENLLDYLNASVGTDFAHRFCAYAVRVLSRVGRLMDSSYDVTGSWYGNDTIWRTVIDLQRIIQYGKLDGSLAETPQRRVINITDAIIAGEGEGPLAPSPVPLGILSLSTNSAAAEWIHALVMGFDPYAIPLITESMKPRWGLAVFESEAVECLVDGHICELQALFNVYGRQFHPPLGWVSHCETLS